MKKTLGLIGTGALAATLTGCPDSLPTEEEETQDIAGMANECFQAALQSADGNIVSKGNQMVSSNLSEYTSGQPFDLRVSLQGKGNSFLQLNCAIDANGNVSYQSYKKTSTKVGEETGTSYNAQEPSNEQP